MSKQTDTNLFMFSPFAKYAGLYQQLISGMASYEQLGNRIIKEIKTAHAFRQVDTVRELSRLLLNIPINEYRLIAQYYLVWCKCRELQYHPQVLERVIEQSETYKTQALISRGALAFYQGKFDEAMFFYTESLKTNPTVSEYLLSVKEIAVIKSIEGFSKTALKDLESLLPLLKYAEPYTRFDVLNSVVVELCDANRLQEAKNVSSLLVSSPFAPYYPESLETFAEVNRKLHKSRSSVTVPAPKKLAEVERPQPQAKVIEFPKKEAPADDLIAELSKFDTISLTPLQLLGVLAKVMFKDRVTDAEIDRFCNVYYQLIREYYAE